MRAIIIMIAVLLGGCSAFHEKPLPPSEATEVLLDVRWVESVDDIPIPYVARRDVEGYTVWVDINDKRKCTIWAVKPYNADDFKHLNTLGHELLHCTDGHYHGRTRDKNGSEMLREITDRP